MSAAIMQLKNVAKAAPAIPQSSGKIKSQSRATFKTEAVRVAHNTSFGLPSNLSANTETQIKSENMSDGANHKR